LNLQPENIDHDLLWQRFKSGDKNSFSLIYEENVEALFNYGRQIVHHNDLVKDAIQDLFVELWHGREKLSNPISIRAYLLKSLRYKLIREQKKSLHLTSGETQGFQLDFSIENKLVNEETNLEILNCLKKNVNLLTFQQREVIFHIIYHDLNYDETAAIMEVSKKTVYNLFSAAIISLREKVKKDYPHKIQLAELLVLLITSCTIV
jgi:RNA polymerase sigma factor (sigma-70 family)